MKQLVRALFAFSCSVLALGCDQQGRLVEEPGLEKLARGISSEGDVRTAMGKPEIVWEEEGGKRTLEYPKGPNGVKTWMFEIGSDGKLKDWHQALTEENFRRVTGDMAMDDVRRLLGKPRSTAQYRLKNEEVWDWLFQEGGTRRLFNVHFDMASRRVLRTTTSDDPDIKP